MTLEDINPQINLSPKIKAALDNLIAIAKHNFVSEPDDPKTWTVTKKKSGRPTKVEAIMKAELLAQGPRPTTRASQSSSQ